MEAMWIFGFQDVIFVSDGKVKSDEIAFGEVIEVIDDVFDSHCMDMYIRRVL